MVRADLERIGAAPRAMTASLSPDTSPSSSPNPLCNPARLNSSASPSFASREAELVQLVITESGSKARRLGHHPQPRHPPPSRAEGPTSAPCFPRADVLVADGMPLIWASRLQKTPLPERGLRLPTPFGRSLRPRPRRAGRSSLLGGAPPPPPTSAPAVLKQRYPQLQITGTCCPLFGFEKKARDPDRYAPRPPVALPSRGHHLRRAQFSQG